AEMRAGNHVVCVHFEEDSPRGSIGRLRELGATDDEIRKQLHWADTSAPWDLHDFARHLDRLPAPPSLVVLDGINAACAQYGWPVEKSEAIGLYKAMLVNPATRAGAAVLSLGNPVKAVARQGERFGYGSGDWLNQVDGASFRLEPSKQNP